jgi:hypothetical protein
MTSAMYCASFSENNQIVAHSSRFQQRDNKKPSDTMKFLYLIAHDSLKKVKKRAIWFKHDSNKSQTTERDFPRLSLLCN